MHKVFLRTGSVRGDHRQQWPKLFTAILDVSSVFPTVLPEDVRTPDVRGFSSKLPGLPVIESSRTTAATFLNVKPAKTTMKKQ